MDNWPGYFGEYEDVTPSNPLHKRIDHLLLPRLVKPHRQLVALHGRHDPVRELLVEHAFAVRGALDVRRGDYAAFANR